MNRIQKFQRKNLGKKESDIKDPQLFHGTPLLMRQLGLCVYNNCNNEWMIYLNHTKHHGVVPSWGKVNRYSNRVTMHTQTWHRNHSSVSVMQEFLQLQRHWAQPPIPMQTPVVLVVSPIYEPSDQWSLLVYDLLVRHRWNLYCSDLSWATTSLHWPVITRIGSKLSCVPLLTNYWYQVLLLPIILFHDYNKICSTLLHMKPILHRIHRLDSIIELALKVPPTHWYNGWIRHVTLLTRPETASVLQPSLMGQ